MYSHRLFFTYGLQDNHWVWHQDTKPVGAVKFQKTKATVKANNDEIGNTEMNILDKGVIYKL